MSNWLQTYFYNVLSLGWSGDLGWSQAIFETLYMTGASAILGGALGLLLGTGLVITPINGLIPHPRLNHFLSLITSIGRALPFVIMVVIVSPLTASIVKTTIGPTAALIPLALSIAPFFARQVEVVFLSLEPGKVEAARAFGATNWHIIKNVYFHESRSELVRVATVTLISLVGLTTMAGVVGAGGLGTTAIVTGYQRFEPDVMWVATGLILILILVIQLSGNWLARRL